MDDPGYDAWLAEMDAHLAYLDQMRAAVCADKRFGFDLPWPAFLRCMRLITAQSSGPRIQNRLAEQLGAQVVPASLNRGDVVDGAGDYHEVKITFVTSSNKYANFVQLRPHQDLAGYHLVVIDEDLAVTHLWLSKADMDGELASLGKVAHGTAAAVADNSTREYAIRIRWTATDTTRARWVASYAQPWAH